MRRTLSRDRRVAVVHRDWAAVVHRDWAAVVHRDRAAVVHRDPAVAVLRVVALLRAAAAVVVVAVVVVVAAAVQVGPLIWKGHSGLESSPLERRRWSWFPLVESGCRS